jgi:hypothetical protein
MVFAEEMTSSGRLKSLDGALTDSQPALRRSIRIICVVYQPSANPDYKVLMQSVLHKIVSAGLALAGQRDALMLMHIFAYGTSQPSRHAARGARRRRSHVGCSLPVDRNLQVCCETSCRCISYGCHALARHFQPTPISSAVCSNTGLASSQDSPLWPVFLMQSKL